MRAELTGAFSRLPLPLRQAVLHRLGRFAPWEEGFDLTAPSPPPGQAVGPPDFVGIGAQKAGTSWWYGMISAHPSVHAPAGFHKERHFLSGFGLADFGPGEIARYHAWFPRPPGKLTGEWTPDYLFYPWAPELLALAAPAARLVVLVRDPIERLRSGLVHQWRNGVPRHGAAVVEALERGRYAAQLSGWLRRFDRSQLLVLQYERCALEPAAALAETYRFLGVDDGFRPASLVGRVAPTLEEKVELGAEVRGRLVGLLSEDVRRLCAEFPAIDLDLWPAFSRGSGAPG